MSTKLKERPLVLTTEEVNAVLAGHKTQHRAIIKMPCSAPEFRGCRDSNQGDATLWGWDGFEDGDVRVLSEIKCPFGAIGDRLWVQEDFIPDPPAGHDAWEDEDSVTNYFQWDGCGSKLSEIPNRLRTSEHVIYKAGQDNPDSMMWFNALQMRKWASRLLLEITDIRIERVQDITLGDSLKEACSGSMDFAVDWMSKHSEGEWFINPWVWVIEFKKVNN